MLGVCGGRCYVELGKNDIDSGMHVEKDGEGVVAFKNKNSEDSTDYPVCLRFVNTENVDKFILLLNDLKGKMGKKLKMKAILNLKNIDNKNQYEVDLNKYNGTEVTILNESGNTYEIETNDGSEYTVFKEELNIS